MPSGLNLFSYFAWPAWTKAGANLPIVVMLHGFSGGAEGIGQATCQRVATRGTFVVAPGMRGRNSALGDADCSGLEIDDIYEVIQYVRATYADYVDVNNVAIAGYSGGGGNAFAFAAKYPDAANVIAVHFGMSDYGYGTNTGWYQDNGSTSHRATIEAWVGGTPAEVPNNYRARNALEAIPYNFTGGHLYLFWDSGETTVPVHHADDVATGMTGRGLTNYTKNYTTAQSTNRWLHAHPNADQPVRFTEDVWAAAAVAKTHPAWTIPTSGEVRVIGYIETKRFAIMLNTGLDAVAHVVYNTAANTYTVTPLTGVCDVYINQAGLTGTASGITTETEIVVS